MSILLRVFDISFRRNFLIQRVNTTIKARLSYSMISNDTYQTQYPFGFLLFIVATSAHLAQRIRDFFYILDEFSTEVTLKFQFLFMCVIVFVSFGTKPVIAIDQSDAYLNILISMVSFIPLDISLHIHFLFTTIEWKLLLHFCLCYYTRSI